MLKTAIPLMHVRSTREGLGFYRDKLGFEVRSTFRLDPGREDPAYHVLTRDGALIHVSSFPGDGVAGGVVTIVGGDIDAMHDELAVKDVDVGSGIMDQTWGDREVYVRDPAGNSVRFQSGRGAGRHTRPGLHRDEDPMPLKLSGSCRCGAVTFSVDSHTPYPYQLCYCSICRKTDGGGGFAINIMGVADTLAVEGREAIGVYRAEIDGETSSGQRNFCTRCGTALWLFDESWPELVHPFASAIDTPLPVPPEKVHLMLRFKAEWVVPDVGPQDRCFELYPEQSIEDWHKGRGLWVA